MRSEFNRLVAKLDKIFSKWVRLSNADVLGRVTCITCGKIIPWKEADCGHYITRARMATRFHEHNTRPQCRYCNRYLEGQHGIFRKRLVEIYGEEEVALMEAFSQIAGGSENVDSLKHKIKYYTEKTKELEEIIR